MLTVYEILTDSTYTPTCRQSKPNHHSIDEQMRLPVLVFVLTAGTGAGACFFLTSFVFLPASDGSY